MSPFLRRLKYYGLGFAFGSVFVFLFFQNRGCSWLPANRVKNAVLDRVISISDVEQQQLAKRGIKNKDIILLLNNGKVDYDASKKNGNMKVYKIYNDELKLYFTLPNECFIAEVKSCRKAAKDVKSTTTGMGSLIHFPKDDHLVFVDTTSQLSCKLEQMGQIQQDLILKSLKKVGRIDFSKSVLDAKPKAKVYLWFNDAKGKQVGSTSIWYKNKINIHQIDLADTTQCN